MNGEGGKLKGLEVNYQHQLKFLPGFLSNLGILANYFGAYVDLGSAVLSAETALEFLDDDVRAVVHRRPHRGKDL